MDRSLLRAFKSATQALSLPRKPVDATDVVVGPNTEELSSELGSYSRSDDPESTSIKNGQLMSLDHCYRRHVKPKKQHEIKKLGEVVNCLSRKQDCDHVVDIGAGQGHLSRVLSFGYGLKVTTVEAAGCHIPKAQKFDREVIKDIEKSKQRMKQLHTVYPNAGKLLEPNHIATWIEPDISPEEFLNVIERSNELNIKSHNQNNNDEKGDESGYSKHHCLIKKTRPLLTCDNFFCGNTVRDDTLNGRLGAVNNTQDKQHLNASACSDKICCDVCCVKRRKIGDDTIPRSFVSPVDVVKSNNMTVDSDDTKIFEIKALVANGVDSMESHPSQIKSNISKKAVNCADKTDPALILTGLHACGDLIPMMLRVFSRSPQLTGLATVGCCYMKLSDDESVPGAPGASVGYPMSGFVRSLPYHNLTYTAREMACHFMDAYHQRLKDNPPELILHSYRAALQEIILDIDPTINHAAIKLTIKKAQQMTFESYASLALEKLGLEHTMTQAQLDRAAGRVASWKDVVIMYVLRLMLAPVVESLILLDRMIYLSEQGIKSQLVPIFDPKLSPRNCVLIAYKDKLDKEQR
ncbi:methyltransferase-like protein 25B isoform X2 [Lineus longissimus]|uniref:methyltransferase-like protein 25B isoform X2 n=1 Tax=Lineus longissimus TaxID=88925 RepID=UPI00315C88A6